MRNSRFIVAKQIAIFGLIAGSLAALPASAGALGQPATAPASKEQPKVEPPKTAPSQDVKPVESKFTYVVLETSMGKIGLELNGEKAPLSAANFVSYVKNGHYAGTIFHRVMDGFMIQGGGFDAGMKQKPTDPPIKNEWKNGLKNKKYTVACARTSVPDSATSQFYINVADNGFLDQPRDGVAAYAVFGKVVSGFEVVDAIKGVKTGTDATTGMPDVPVEKVTITGAKVVTKEEAQGKSESSEKKDEPEKKDAGQRK
ncbi:MAG: peptidylprolyl isomerase [Phycisphaerales bacterium]|nr:peptidylprolyl isomerase [Phycisphaerales bacterium]